MPRSVEQLAQARRGFEQYRAKSRSSGLAAARAERRQKADPERTGPRHSAGPCGKHQASVLVVLRVTLTGILGLLAWFLATTLLLAGLLLAAALLVLTTLTTLVLTTLTALLVLTTLTGILRVLVLWILAHRYSLQLPQPQFNRWQNKVANIDLKNLG
jgi:hypothetical protein